MNNDYEWLKSSCLRVIIDDENLILVTNDQYKWSEFFWSSFIIVIRNQNFLIKDINFYTTTFTIRLIKATISDIFTTPSVWTRFYSRHGYQLFQWKEWANPEDSNPISHVVESNIELWERLCKRSCVGMFGFPITSCLETASYFLTNRLERNEAESIFVNDKSSPVVYTVRRTA